jgi:hypothetical protein
VHKAVKCQADRRDHQGRSQIKALMIPLRPVIDTKSAPKPRTLITSCRSFSIELLADPVESANALLETLLEVNPTAAEVRPTTL